MAKKIPEINASSMADISFLLLIFFLVTTSMDVNQGLARRLPAPVPPDAKVEDTDINKRNLFVVKINWENRLLVQGQERDVGHGTGVNLRNFLCHNVLQLDYFLTLV